MLTLKKMHSVKISCAFQLIFHTFELHTPFNAAVLFSPSKQYDLIVRSSLFSLVLHQKVYSGWLNVFNISRVFSQSAPEVSSGLLWAKSQRLSARVPHEQIYSDRHWGFLSDWDKMTGDMGITQWTTMCGLRADYGEIQSGNIY